MIDRVGRVPADAAVTRSFAPGRGGRPGPSPSSPPGQRSGPPCPSLLGRLGSFLDSSLLGRLGSFLEDPTDALPARSPTSDGGSGSPEGQLSGRATLRARLRSFSLAHPQWVDTGLAVVLALLSTPWLLHDGAHDLGLWIFQVALIVPIAWRRRHPVGVFATLSLVALVQWLFSDRLPADLSLLVALYAVAVQRPRRTALAAAAILELGVGMATARWTPTGSWIRSLVFLSGMVAAAVLLGANVRARRAHLAMLTERAQRLEDERDQQARIAAAAERTRIAREMHDVLAHSLAVMVSLADGASAKMASEPDRAAVAIAHVSALGRQSLSDTRRLLGVLRADDASEPTTPQPDIRQLDDLVARVCATGLDASLDVAGVPFDVAPGAGLTVYRIVQEALTNSLKHATGARSVRVRLRYQAPALDVEVTDDGISRWPPPAVNGQGPQIAGPQIAGPQIAGPQIAGPQIAGHGLAGMRERAAVYRGVIAAGPGPDGGWRVLATLPIGPGAP